MAITIQCPNLSCNASATVDDSISGRAVKCKKCGTPFRAVASNDGETTPNSSNIANAFPTLPAEFGRYRVMKLLGRGGMGAVYLANDSQLDRMVALKLPNFAATDTRRVERFVRESKSAARLSHPNICPVYDAGQINARPFISMAFIEGKPLEDLIDSDQLMPVPKAIELIRKIAAALQDAHGEGIIHRDLKPANIMINSKGEPIVMDFGLAKRLNEVDSQEAKLTRDGAIMGTPSYMPPEQVKGELAKIAAASDVYSLGVILFELLTGKTPYNGPLSMVLGQIMVAPVPGVCEFSKEIDPRLEQVCRKAMAKEPGDRYASMAEFSAALEKCLQTPEDSVFSDLRTSQSVAQPSKPRKQPASGSKLPIWIGLAVSLILSLGTVFFSLKTKYGEVQIELSNPSAKVDVSVDGERIDVTAIGKSYQFKAGEHGLTVTGDGFESITQSFNVLKGKTEIVKVTLKPKVEPFPKTIKNGIGMEFVLVGKGTAWLGGGGGKPGERKHEIANDFYMGKYEVTQEEWETVTGQNPSHFSRNGAGKDLVKDIPDADLKRFPVEMVSWNDCQLFIELLNKKEKDSGWVYRLPKEEEWEYACRGGPVDKLDSAFDFYFVKPTNLLLPEQANFSPVAEKDQKRLQPTCKVGTYQPNRLGLHDMHGNVHEWCDNLNSPQGVTRASCGGNCFDFEDSCRSTARGWSFPSNRAANLGFRLARFPARSAAAVAATTDPDRKAAEYVLSIGGTVVVELEGKILLPVKIINELPKAQFQLKELNLHGNTQVSDARLAQFKDCKNLKSVGLTHTQVTNAGLIHFKDCKFLAGLDVQGTQVTDSGLAYFKDFTNLNHLNLSITNISDSGLAHIKDYKYLVALNISKTKVTAAKFEELKKTFPKCKIISDYGTYDPSAPFKNTIGMEFVKVPKGTGWLGGGGGKQGDRKHEIAQDFYMGKYEITQEEWEIVMGLIPSHFSRKGAGKDVVKDIPEADLKRFPVENVSWDDCQLFIKKLNEKENGTGWVYRLPKEAEWEYACRGGPVDKLESGYDFYFAKPTNLLFPAQANIQQLGKGLVRTCKVGSYQANPLGLFDMHGNVWEWCDDTAKAADGASHRVHRGGGWFIDSGDCRAAFRSSALPSFQLGNLGLRLARVPIGPAVAAVPATPEPTKKLPVAINLDRRAAEEVFKLGGNVGVVLAETKNRIDEVPQLAGLPQDPFHVVVIRLGNQAGATDSTLGLVRGLPALQILELNGTPVTNEGLQSLKQLKSLEVINLAGTAVNDAGLAHLVGLTGLKGLIVNDVQLTDKGADFLQQLANLEWLEMNGTGIKDEGLGKLKRLEKLRVLGLDRSKVTSDGLKHIETLPSLVDLFLSGVPITDEGLAHLARVSKLRILRLNRTQITDRGLEYLRELKALQVLELAGTQVTDAGVNRLQAALPKCSIKR
jgi:predicted Zn finger-like uncharacterized protein